jgi:hypothetical protein
MEDQEEDQEEEDKDEDKEEEEEDKQVRWRLNCVTLLFCLLVAGTAHAVSTMCGIGSVKYVACTASVGATWVCFRR